MRNIGIMDKVNGFSAFSIYCDAEYSRVDCTTRSYCSIFDLCQELAVL
jgi:hypothetical protein